MKEQFSWQAPLAECITDNSNRGGLLVLMPEYRPDITLSIAHHFHFEFLDYRKVEMMPLGWEADCITLENLNETLQSSSTEQGLVAFNVEALLATKDEAQRQQWFGEFLQAPWPHPVLVPLVIYCEEAPQSSPRVCDMQDIKLPEQGLVSRLVM